MLPSAVCFYGALALYACVHTCVHTVQFLRLCVSLVHIALEACVLCILCSVQCAVALAACVLYSFLCCQVQCACISSLCAAIKEGTIEEQSRDTCSQVTNKTRDSICDK